ncbi:MAG: PqiC family protein [Agarilytica sp.]
MSNAVQRSSILVTKFSGLLCLVTAVLVGINGCASSGPATRFYSLFSERDIAVVEHQLGGVSIGIGPIVLPDYLDNPAVVSVTGSQRVRIAGYHAWAGSLKDSMTRVLADNASQSLALEGVWGFPWDNRTRPDYQVRIVIEQFDGVRGGEAQLRAKWTVLNKKADKILKLGSVSLSETASSDGVDDYVAALNRLLNALSGSIAESLSTL